MSSQQSFLVVVLGPPGNSITAPTTFSLHISDFFTRNNKKCLVSSRCSIPCSSNCVRGGETEEEEAVKRRKTRSSRERKKERGVIHLYTFSLLYFGLVSKCSCNKKKISNGRLKKLFIKRQWNKKKEPEWPELNERDSCCCCTHDCGKRGCCSFFISSDFTLTFRSIQEIAFRKFDSTIYGIIWFVMGGRQQHVFLPYQIAVRSKVEPVTAYRELDVYRYHLEMFSPPGWRHNFVPNEKLGLPVESSILVEVDTESEIGSAGSPVRQGAGDVHVERQNFNRQ